MNKIYFPKRRKIFLSTNYDVPKIIVKTEENEGISIPNETRFKNWNDVFRDFLSETLLKSKQTQLKRNTETSIDRAYLYEVPLQFDNALSISPSKRRKFLLKNLQLEKINLKNLINQFHQLSRQEKDQKINVTYHRSAVIDEGNHDVAFLQLLDEKNKVMLKKQQALDRFDIIRDLIAEKIEKREKEDLVQKKQRIKKFWNDQINV
ncbi:unnamed protein product [Paramecium pentaurelia]|uniref:Uncharacterized protein n=1 Tax=Paramecium pentaurelia TaxID=43138 RepID=A0A8S1S5G1_9CILI|nr:unnamed protein product [Paramecium pentaurelia]